MITQTARPRLVLDCPQTFPSRQIKQLDLSRPHIMGILNVTPDSFSDGGRFTEMDAALYQCELMLADGASIIDVGGESTRPNAKKVTLDDEAERVLPVVEAIAKRFDTIISVDTSTPELMVDAMAVGGHIWNDVRALRRDGAADVAAQLNVPVMLMHSRGEPDTMMDMTQYEDVVYDVATELRTCVKRAEAAGVRRDNMILDVGFGFAKTTQQNLRLLKQLHAFHELGLPLMIGLSRKRMLADVLANNGLDNGLENRTMPGVAAALLACQQGVSIIRTHNVRETKQALVLQNAVDMI